MDELPLKPKIKTEIETASNSVLIIGEKSFFFSSLREILISKGALVNESSEFNYLFQLGDFEKIDFSLKRAAENKAKFFLILNREEKNDFAQKAELKVLKMIESRKLDGKIIKLSGFLNDEIEAVKKILKIALSQTGEKIINLTGPGILLTKTPAKKQTKIDKKLWLLTGFFLILTLPLTFLLTNIFLGIWDLQRTETAVLGSAFSQGEKQALSAQKHFATAEKTFLNLVPLLQFFGKEEETRKFSNWLRTGQDVSRASRYLIKVGQEGQKLSRLFFGQEIGNPEELLSKMTPDLDLAENELALIEARNDNPPFLADKFAKIKNLRKSLVKVKNFLGIAPWILNNRTYLFLFQNNFELRPGGGFIGTIGLLTIRNGKMEFKIEDVYIADGQLKGHVEPPEPLKIYLNQIHWYLRDSNWEPDFPANARKAAWFLEKELGVRVDGVIALDLELAKKILAVTGPVDLPDYQEKITPDNLFLKAEIHSQENFFPGSTQKKDFFGSLTNALFNKLITNKNLSLFALGKVIEEAFEEKHLFIYLDNPLAQKIMSDQNWAGEVQSVNCGVATNACFGDYLMVSEANLGVNKVNYFIKRQIKRKLEFNQAEIRSITEILYENTSPANITFAGAYKNYLRVYLAPNTILEKIKVDDKELVLTKEVDRDFSYGKTAAGFLINVRPGEKTQVEITSKVVLESPASDLTYQLLVQKQPGTDKDSFNLQITALDWQIGETNFPGVAKNGIISYNGDLSLDRIFIIKLSKHGKT